MIITPIFRLQYRLFMKKSKLITLLQTFSDKEMKRFVEFAQSPYFNKSKNLSRFCELLAKIHPEFSEDSIAKERLYTEVFGIGKPYHDATMRNLISDAMSLAENFLVQANLELAPMEAELYLARELVMRDTFRLAEKKLSDIDAALNQLNHSQGFYYQWRILYYRLTDYLYYKQQKIDHRNRTLQQKLNNIFCNFWLDMFNLYSVMVNLNKTTTAHSFQLKEAEAAIKLFNPARYEQQPQIIVAYYMACLSDANAGWDVFLDLHNAIKKYRQQLGTDIVIRANVFMANYLVHSSHISPDARQLLLDLYLDNVTLHEQRKENIPAWLFDVITDTGYWVKGEAWVQQFINRYESHILPDVREGWLMYAKARLYFYRANYTETIALLAVSTPFHEQYYFYTRPLMLYAYFATGNYDAFTTLLDTLKHTLSRRKNELAPPKYQAIKNSLAILPKMFKLKNNYTPALYAALQTELENPEVRMHYKTWLQQQLAAMKQTLKTQRLQKTRK
ncbi:hypothetical protein C7N43_14785 [Sphingobacteriales bacterium UPWRP_1]|nr:hypothetical protein BVG80_05165 [Sphingobacteriales bacterium TSM_CSM]PSJ76261.1 hypothetical protein C7N43_14785 [Sphingobacteriales bacterium UPWRP_1]